MKAFVSQRNGRDGASGLVVRLPVVQKFPADFVFAAKEMKLAQLAQEILGNRRAASLAQFAQLGAIGDRGDSVASRAVLEDTTGLGKLNTKISLWRVVDLTNHMI